MTRSLTLDILFSTLVRKAVVAKLVILGISFLISFMLPLRVVLVAKLAIPGAFTSKCFFLALQTSFLTTSFLTISLSLLKSTGAGTDLSTPNLYTLLLKFLKLLDTFYKLSISNLSASDFKLAASVFSVKSNLSTHAAFFKSGFVA